MPYGFGYGWYGYGYGYGGILNQLIRFIGETVTIYTTSGSQSDRIYWSINRCESFICYFGNRSRTAPACSLETTAEDMKTMADMGCGGYGGIYSVGSITNIPVYMIASFSHNTI